MIDISQNLNILQRISFFLYEKKNFFHVKILGRTAMGRKLHAGGYVSAHARYAAALQGTPPAAHQVLARLCRHLLSLKKKSFSRQF
jgi:hypothetical protein